MKMLYVFGSLVFSITAQGGELDGLTFCRNVELGSISGQPARIRSHCLSFFENIATDNASTFFGNPPKRFLYDIVEKKIFNVDLNKATGYELQDDAILLVETGVVLVVKPLGPARKR